MEGFLVFVWILGVVWSVLCIILFFKVWGMCNNVSKILALLEGKENNDNSKNKQPKKTHIETPAQARINPWK